MKKLKIGKESFVILIVLTSIAIVAGFVLGVMNKITYVDETEALKTEIGKLYTSPIKEQLVIDNYMNTEYTEIMNAFEAEDGAIIIKSHSEKAYSSKGLSLLVIIKDGEVIKVDGSGNSETPGLGSKALAKDYLNQFVGISIDYFNNETESSEPAGNNQGEINLVWDFQSSFETNSNESDSGIAGISGATKTSTGVKYAMKAACVFYNSIEVADE